MTNKLLFLDTETTGLDKEDRLIEIAFTADNTLYDEQFKPPLPIKPMASATNHIIDRMVADKPAFEGSELQQTLQEFADQDYILIAHNAPFDLKMLAKDGVEFKRSICTQKLAMHLDKEEVLENYKEQYLRYYYGIDIPDAVAHSASGDIAVLEALFKILSKDLTIEEMLEITEMKEPLMVKLPWKNHKDFGRPILEVFTDEPGLKKWTYDNHIVEKRNERWVQFFEAHYPDITIPQK